MKFILGNVKIVILVVNKSIYYLLFRVYSTEELMIKAATTMAAARMERSESGQQFLIPRPEENSWGHKRVLDKARIVREFVEFTPIKSATRRRMYVYFPRQSYSERSSGPGLNSL